MKLQPAIWNSPRFMHAQRHTPPSLQVGKEVGFQNGLRSREYGERKESNTALHYVSQVLHSCSS